MNCNFKVIKIKCYGQIYCLAINGQNIVQGFKFCNYSSWMSCGILSAQNIVDVRKRKRRNTNFYLPIFRHRKQDFGASIKWFRLDSKSMHTSVSTNTLVILCRVLVHYVFLIVLFIVSTSICAKDTQQTFYQRRNLVIGIGVCEQTQICFYKF